jgi:ABC-2 type transport system ATP-binding protein
MERPTMNYVHTQSPVMLELRRLHRFFGKTPAVNDVSFEVSRGTVFGFIGPNGAGKTTTMRILATLELPTYGDALISGVSCINDPDVVRKRMGFMPDGFGTYHNMNCVEYLDFFARAFGLVGRERNQRIRETLAFTGLDNIAAKNIRGLSKGMRQRLCLGRAMIHDPDVLILDEPANGLDPRARIELRQMITQLASEGKTILVSSHILTELAEMCDQVGIIERGQLLATGTVDEIQRKQKGTATVTIRTIRNVDAIAQLLRDHPRADSVEIIKDSVHCQWLGDDQEQSALLRSVIMAGHDVLEFTSKPISLEDVFMQVTTGAVQ